MEILDYNAIYSSEPGWVKITADHLDVLEN